MEKACFRHKGICASTADGSVDPNPLAAAGVRVDGYMWIWLEKGQEIKRDFRKKHHIKNPEKE